MMPKKEQKQCVKFLSTSKLIYWGLPGDIFKKNEQMMKKVFDTVKKDLMQLHNNVVAESAEQCEADPRSAARRLAASAGIHQHSHVTHESNMKEWLDSVINQSVNAEFGANCTEEDRQLITQQMMAHLSNSINSRLAPSHPSSESVDSCDVPMHDELANNEEVDNEEGEDHEMDNGEDNEAMEEC